MRPFQRLLQQPRTRSLTSSHHHLRRYHPSLPLRQKHASDVAIVHRRWLTLPLLAKWTIYSATTYCITVLFLSTAAESLEGEGALEFVEIEVPVDQVEAEDDEDGEEEDDDVLASHTVIPAEEAENVFFIPLQLPRALPKHAYNGSEPEHLEYQALDKDEGRQESAKNTLAKQAFDSINTQTAWKKMLGGEIEMSRHWLSFKYPSHAPLKYLRKGLVLTDDGLMWSSQILNQEQYGRLMHVIRPIALLESGYRTAKVFYSMQKVRVKTTLGLQLSPQDHKFQQTMRKTEQFIQGRMLPEQQPEGKAGLASSKADSLPHSPTQPSSPFWGLSVKPPTGFQNMGSGSDPWVQPWVLLQTLVFHVRRTFKQSSKTGVTRGACLLGGVVEISGARGTMLVGIVGEYDPKSNHFLWVDMNPKSFTPRPLPSPNPPRR